MERVRRLRRHILRLICGIIYAMGFDFKFSFGGGRDTLVFQVSAEFVEVVALRAVDASKTADGECEVELLYSKRMPLDETAIKKGKASLLSLAEKVESLANEVMVSKELLTADFNIGDARIFCIYVAPLSMEANITYAVQLKEETKVTVKLLSSVLNKGEITLDELANIPQDYAVYNDKVNSVCLNGYSTQRPLGKYTKRIELTVAKYLTTSTVWAAVSTVLERTFNRDLTYIHAECALETESEELCNKIYTGDELQLISRDIL